MVCCRGNCLLYFTAGTASVLSLMVGFMVTWTSPVLPKMDDPQHMEENPLEKPLTKSGASWIGCLMAVGSSLGPYLFVYSNDKFGRKPTLIIAGLPFLVSFLMLSFARTVILFYVARIIAGLSCGGMCTILPIYLAEIAPDALRGMIASYMGIFQTTGMLFVLVLGPFVSIMTLSLTISAFPVVYVIVFLFLPETPYYLCKVEKYDSAKQALKKLRKVDEEELLKEMEKIKGIIENDRKGTLSDLVKSKGAIKALIISLALAFLQPLTGMKVFLFYGQIIFEASGSSIAPYLSAIMVGVVQMISSFSAPLLVDKLGRKFLLISSSAGMIIFLTMLGAYFHLKDLNIDVSTFFWIPVLCLLMFIVFYNLGFATVPWVIMAEVFSSNVKSMASSLTASINSVAIFFTTMAFLMISEQIGMASSFWGFSVFNLVAIIFVVAYVPETKGKNFQEIQELLDG